jgi:hypothetical protein
MTSKARQVALAVAASLSDHPAFKALLHPWTVDRVAFCAQDLYEDTGDEAADRDRLRASTIEMMAALRQDVTALPWTWGGFENAQRGTDLRVYAQIPGLPYYYAPTVLTLSDYSGSGPLLKHIVELHNAALAAS